MATTTREIMQAYENGALVTTRDGFECVIQKIKDGRAKVRTLTPDGRIMQAWVWLETLSIKP